MKNNSTYGSLTLCGLSLRHFYIIIRVEKSNRKEQNLPKVRVNQDNCDLQ